MSKLETETSAAKTIQAYKDAASPNPIGFNYLITLTKFNYFT
jgi:hypothetical protein